ncbi:hypothetical protein HK098_006020 [Nowakowskiella sp. JEL0407]|nr:hypothetical protein HK098_006020 [Nowakowskiella sp. JEL0407]
MADLKLFVNILMEHAAFTETLNTVLSVKPDSSVADLVQSVISLCSDLSNCLVRIQNENLKSRWSFRVSSIKLQNFELLSTDLIQQVFNDFITPESSLEEKTWVITISLDRQPINTLQTPCPLLSLSTELHIAISKYFNKKEKIRLSSTCTQLRPIHFNEFWKSVRICVNSNKAVKFLKALKDLTALHAFRTNNRSVEILIDPYRIFNYKSKEDSLTVLEYLGGKLESLSVDALCGYHVEVADFYSLLGVKLCECRQTMKSLTVHVEDCGEVCDFLTTTLPHLERLENLSVEKISVEGSKIRIPKLSCLKRVELEFDDSNQNEELLQIVTRDLVNCKALEEVVIKGADNYVGEIKELLANLQIKTLRFGSKAFGERVFHDVADGISRNTSLRMLDFGRYSYIDSGINLRPLFAAILRRNEYLEEFVFPGLDIKEVQVESFANFLIGNPKIRCLDISGVDEPFAYEHMDLLFGRLFEVLASNTSIESLVCKEMYFPSVTVVQVGFMLSENKHCSSVDFSRSLFSSKSKLLGGLGRNSALRIFDLSFVTLTNYGDKIANVLLKNFTMTDIRFKRCSLNKQDCHLVVLGLFGNRNVRERALDLRENGITNLGITQMIGASAQNADPLTFSIEKLDDDDFAVIGKDDKTKIKFVINNDVDCNCYFGSLQKYFLGR